MKKPGLAALCLLFLFIPALHIFPSDAELSGMAEPSPRDDFLRRGLIATGEALFSSLAVMGFNNFIMQYDWAYPTRAAIRKNFTEPWHWDDSDGFIVNHLGHPTQGSQYFVAGRVNRFSFYESMFFTVFGSFVWENFFENHGAAMNDFIVTTTASMPLGEMLYRLYVEAYAAGVPAPLAFIINPMAGFHRLVTGWQPPNYGRKLYQFRTYAGIGYTGIHSSAAGIDEKLFSFRGPFVHLGFSIIYANPFEQESRIPFNHFELEVFAGADIGNYLEGGIISDGYLFSFSPVYTNTNMMSTGLSLHLDSMIRGRFNETDSTINLFSNALNWTVKHKYLFSQDVSIQIKAHAGFTFFGSGAYYSLERERDLAFYGFGLNSKLFFTLEHTRLGKLETSVFGYRQWNYPGSSLVSGGGMYWLFTDIAYSFRITENLSLRLANSFAMERGLFDNHPHTGKYSNIVKCFVVWYW